MDNDQRELYERGVADAAHNDLNLFYYQHYYYYRKGYDELRRSQARWHRKPLGLLSGGLLIVLAVALYLAPQWSNTAPSAPVAQSALPPAPASLPTVPPAAPPLAEPNPEPPVPPADAPINADVLQPVPVGLQPGIQVLVMNVGDASLRLRQTASLEADVVVRLDEGTLVSIIGGPVEADGYIWWELEHATGRGWGAERSLEGLPWLAVVQ
ncbi:MAG: hypothetical protein HC911_07010 [Chloroflexaceae bacterium]|nr:hypothetical protein [Chloroflexaceae bacterium]